MVLFPPDPGLSLFRLHSSPSGLWSGDWGRVLFPKGVSGGSSLMLGPPGSTHPSHSIWCHTTPFVIVPGSCARARRVRCMAELAAHVLHNHCSVMPMSPNNSGASCCASRSTLARRWQGKWSQIPSALPCGSSCAFRGTPGSSSKLWGLLARSFPVLAANVPAVSAAFRPLGRR